MYRIGDYITTFTGKKFYVLDPRPEDIDIIDIAHALSNICRFGGHCSTFYSVASHCCNVSYEVPETHALCALLHDASEAYLGDLPRPIKNMDTFKAYKDAEAKLEKAIADRFGIQYPMPDAVKAADDKLLAIEARMMMRWDQSEYDKWKLPSYEDKIALADRYKHLGTNNTTFKPLIAKHLFLLRYHEVGGKS